MPTTSAPATPGAGSPDDGPVKEDDELSFDSSSGSPTVQPVSPAI